MHELLPCLRLNGISTGDFGEALEALAGPQVHGLSSSTISRLKQVWTRECEPASTSGKPRTVRKLMRPCSRMVRRSFAQLSSQALKHEAQSRFVP